MLFCFKAFLAALYFLNFIKTEITFNLELVPGSK